MQRRKVSCERVGQVRQQQQQQTQQQQLQQHQQREVATNCGKVRPVINQFCSALHSHFNLNFILILCFDLFCDLRQLRVAAAVATADAAATIFHYLRRVRGSRCCCWCCWQLNRIKSFSNVNFIHSTQLSRRRPCRLQLLLLLLLLL